MQDNRIPVLGVGLYGVPHKEALNIVVRTIGVKKFKIIDLRG